MMRKFFPLILLMLIPAVVLAATNPAKTKIKNYPILTGSEDIQGTVVYPPYGNPMQSPDAVDLIGDTASIGTTWYENQHNGTCSRMLEKSSDGYLHLVWMNGVQPGNVNRHVYYNAIDPTGAQLWPATGYPVESAVKGGFANVDVDFGGIAFPAYHEIISGDADPHTAVAPDYFPHSGAFGPVQPNWYREAGTDVPLIWPRMQFDNNQVMHVVATQSTAAAGDPQQQFYTVGTYDPLTYTLTFPPSPDTWTYMKHTMTIAADIGTSDVSDRVAFAWAYPKDPGFPYTPPSGGFSQRDNDIWVLIDDDGQDFSFDDAFNLTQFIPPDLGLLPDTVMADMDTLRAYTDLNVFIDQDDWVHVSFTTPSLFMLEGTTYWHPSVVWHWSEQFPGEFQIVHNAFDDWWWNFVDCGAWNVKAQRPELGQDPNTGYLYCMYQVYDVDTTHLSAQYWPSGEIYMSVSTDGGRNWAVGTNVTNTITPDLAPPGQCLSELTPSMAKTVDGTAHILYVVDRDAGNLQQTEGTETLNPVIYHSVSVDDIPTTPLVDQEAIPFHVEHGPPVGVPGNGRFEVASRFALQQNYPNPFNPVTSITFSLDEVSGISLNVYNLKGEMVASVASGTYSAGYHTVNFDGSGLASGVYVYKLTAGDRSIENKMLLLK